MKDDEPVTWNGSVQQMIEIREWLGERPGNKVVDPYYVRKGYGGKYYLWNEFTKSWTRLSPGDTIFIRGDHSVGLSKRPKVA